MLFDSQYFMKKYLSDFSYLKKTHPLLILGIGIIDHNPPFRFDFTGAGQVALFAFSVELRSGSSQAM